MFKSFLSFCLCFLIFSTNSFAKDKKHDERFSKKYRDIKESFHKSKHHRKHKKKHKHHHHHHNKKFTLVDLINGNPGKQNIAHHFSIEALESDRLDTLEFEISKHPRKHKRAFLKSITYNNLNIEFSKINDKYKFSFDISSFDIGVHEIQLRVGIKTSHRSKTHYKSVKVRFKRQTFDTAHALVSVENLHPVGNSQANFEFNQSYSDGGHIEKYEYKLFKDNIEIENGVKSADDGQTNIHYFFKDAGSYYIELTVTDNLGDTDSVSSEIINVSIPSPLLEYTITQDPNQKDIFTIDFSGTKAPEGEEIAHYFAAAISNYGEEGEEWHESAWSDRVENISKKRQLQVKARGDIQFLVWVETKSGTNTSFVTDIYNIPNETPSILFLNYAWEFPDENNPKIHVYALEANVTESEFKQFNYKLTDESGNIITGINTDYSPFSDETISVLHANLKFPYAGVWKIEVTLELNDGRVSYPFIYSHTLPEFDLGEATLNINLSPEFEGASNDLKWLIDLDNSHPGNFGEFQSFYCDFNGENESFRIENEWTEFHFSVPKDLYSVDCFGVTSTDLISAPVHFDIDARNLKPVIISMDINISDETWKYHEFWVDSSDSDGYIEFVDLKLISPSGIITEYTSFDLFGENLFEEGQWSYELTAFDNELLASDPFSGTFNVTNATPKFDEINISKINKRDYNFQVSMSDSDGYVEGYSVNFTDPNGGVYHYEYTENFDFTFWITGTWNLEFIVRDNLGKTSTTTRSVEIINIKPVTDFEILTISEYGRQFEFRPTKFLDEEDTNPSRAELTVSSPTGVISSYNTYETMDLYLETPGTYYLTYIVYDGEGLGSDPVSKTVNVINQNPIPVMNITQIAVNRIYLVVEDSYDLDGEVVEHSFEFFGPNGEYLTRNSEGSFDIELASAGEWRILYGVKDNDGAWSRAEDGTFYFEVVNTAPRIELSYEALNEEKRFYKVSGNILDDTENFTYIYKITDPDNEVYEQPVDGLTFEYYFNKYGSWRVELTATDEEGLVSQSEILINTINNAPIISIDADRYEAKTFEVIEFNALNTFDPNDDSLIYTWNFDDGATLSGKTVYHFFETEGTHSIEFVAVDPYGAESRQVFNVNILAATYTPPISKFTTDGDFSVEGKLRGEIYLNGLTSESTEGEIVSYQWYVDDMLISEESTTLYKFLSTGVHQIRLDITSEFGVIGTKSLEMDVIALEKPSDIESIHELEMTGLDLIGFNPINSTATLTLVGASELKDTYSVFLNEIEITNAFTKTGTSFQGTLNSTEGINLLEVYVQDELENFKRVSYRYYAGSINQKVKFLDANGMPLSGIDIFQEFKNNILESKKFTTDSNGDIELINAPDIDSVITAHSGRNYLNQIVEEGKLAQSYTLIELEAPSLIDNSDFSDGINGWSLTNLNYQLGEIYGDKNIIFEQSTTGYSEIKKHFINSHTDSYIKTTVRIPKLPEELKVQLSFENITTGERENYLFGYEESTNERAQDLQIWANQNDELILKVKYLEAQNVVGNYLRNFMTAHAITNSPISIKELKYYRTKYNVILKDLNNSAVCVSTLKNPCTEYFRLYEMNKISIGSYVYNNRIYADLKFENKKQDIKNITFNSIEIYEDNLLRYSENVPSNFLENIKDIDRISEGVYEVDNTKTSLSGGSIQNPTSTNSTNEFIPYIEIPSNTFSETAEKIRFRTSLLIEYIDGSLETIYSEKVISTILKQHNHMDKHYEELNTEKPDHPDNGDNWSTDLAIKFLDDLFNKEKIGLLIGDNTNINGAEKGNVAADKLSLFNPHSWHNDGNRFDMKSKNFSKDVASAGLDFKAFLDLKHILDIKVNNINKLKDRIEKIIVDKVDSDDNSTEIQNYNNYCLLGKSIDYLYSDSDSSKGLRASSGNHLNHWHIKLNASENPSYFSKLSDESEKISYTDFAIVDGFAERTISVDIGNAPYIRLYRMKDYKFIEDLPESEYTIIDNISSLTIRINLNYFNQHSKEIKMYVSKNLTVPGSCTDTDILFGQEIDDCNLDGVKDDPAIINEYGGIVGVESSVDSSWMVSDGARVCGLSEINAFSANIAGSRVVLENVKINDKCNYLQIRSTGNIRSDVSGQITNGVKVSDSVLCSDATDNFGFIGNDEFREFNFSKSEAIGNFVYFVNSNVNNSTILGEINSINMRYKDSIVSGIMYNENGIVDNSFVVVPDTPYDNSLAGEGNVIISTIQSGQIYGSVIGGYVLIHGNIINSEVKASTPTPTYLENNSFNMTFWLGIDLRARVENATVFGNTHIKGSVKDGAVSNSSSRNLISTKTGKSVPGRSVISDGAGMSGANAKTSGVNKIACGTLKSSLGHNRFYCSGETEAYY